MHYKDNSCLCELEDTHGKLRASTFKTLIFRSQPVSSMLRYTYGDDNKGNVTFPTVTICVA